MKKTVALLLILVLCLSSCKTTDEETAYIDETIAATESKEETEQVEEKSEQITVNDSTESEEKESDTTTQIENDQPEQKNDKKPEETQTDSSADEQHTEQSEAVTGIPDTYADVFNEDVKYDTQLNDLGTSEYGCSGYAVIEIDGIEYSRMYNEPEQFPARSTRYADVDIQSLPLTDKVVKMTYWDDSEIFIDGFSPTEYSVDVTLHELPEEMANDKYIDIIAAKLPDGKSRVFYKYKNQSKLGDLWDMYTEHFSLPRSTADDIKSIEITFSSDATAQEKIEFAVTESSEIEEIYKRLREFTLDDEENSSGTQTENKKDFSACICVNYTDGETIEFGNTSNNLIRYYSSYIGTQEFTDYLWKTVKEYM